MHDAVAETDQYKATNESKHTLDIKTKVSVIEEDSSKEPELEKEENNEHSVSLVGKTNSTAMGGSSGGTETGEKVEPMKVEPDDNKMTNKDDDGDVVMEEAGEVASEVDGSATVADTAETTEKEKTPQDNNNDEEVKENEAKKEDEANATSTSGSDEKKDEEKATAAASSSDENKDENEATAAASDSDEKKKEEKPTAASIGSDENKATTAASASDENKDEEKVEGAASASDEKKDEEKAAAASASDENKEEEKATAAASASDEKKKIPVTSGSTSEVTGKIKEDTKVNGESSTSNSSSTNPAVATSSPQPPPPMMKGTLSYDLEQRRHLIRGMWNYENSNVFPPQRFELLRNLDKDEDPTILPVDGEFHGSFSLAYFHTTSKGKQKERSKVISESGVKIKFSLIDGSSNEYKMEGKGTNQFGEFHIEGSATKSTHEGDPTFNIVYRKRYAPSPQVVPTTPAAADSSATKKKKDKRPDSGSAAEPVSAKVEGPLPPPSESFPSGVVCLRGKVSKESTHELGLPEAVHRINGIWAAGLDYVLSDPQNVRGLCNRFEYEHKSSVPSNTFPVSGRYTGWFDLSNEDGSRTRINERDILLKFKKNNAGYYNVEGKGSNVFGKYSITGSLTKDNVITIFRHFQPRKLKNAKANAASSSGIAKASAARNPSIVAVPQAEPKLKLSDVVIPGDTGNPDDRLAPIQPPDHTTYAAVLRGVLKVNEDGSHSCQGKWAVHRQHLDTNGSTSPFNIRLEAHFAAAAKKLLQQNGTKSAVREFPFDSAMYKGSFQMRKSGSRTTKIVDQQIVMRFRPNTDGSYNVYGKGINQIGEFNLLGTMILSGKTGGHVELYRMYPPEKLNPVKDVKKETSSAKSTAGGTGKKSAASVPKSVLPTTTGSAASGGMQPLRRESTRLVKLPSRLEDGDPSAQLSRTMDKCSQILRHIREKDVELGAFFSEPVDPVALGIPSYLQVIREPMDLKTVHRKLEASEIQSPEEFARLVRLVFENAMTFNIDPAHSVHQAARSLLIQFNQKFRDVDRMIQTIRKQQEISEEESGKKKKDEKKRKRKDGTPYEEVKSLKRRRLDEVTAMAAANSNALTSIYKAAPAVNSATAPVTRQEFHLLLHMIQQLQRHVIQTHTAVAELSPGDENDAKIAGSKTTGVAGSGSARTPALGATAQEKKKNKRKNNANKAPSATSKTAAAQASALPLAIPKEDNRALTLDEQELLTETINELPPEHLGGVIQIIREAAPVGADEDEIDLEIDQLAVSTQRKLLRHVMKYVKRSKAKKKTKKESTQKKASEKLAKSSTSKAKSDKAKTKQATDRSNSFFSFDGGSNHGSDSDSDEDSDHQPTNNGGKVFSPPGGAASSGVSSSKNNEFKLNHGINALHGDDDDDDDDEGGFAANWNLSGSTEKNDDGEEEDTKDDDAWGAAREAAAVQKVRDKERQVREEKRKAEAEQLKHQRLADAAARGEEIKAQREEEVARVEREKEQAALKAKEESEKAREEARARLAGVEQTIDLDAQRDIMKQYEQTYLDKDLGGGSPSSDFGF